MNKGYIRLYRQLQDCWIWIDEESPEKFTRGSAWIDLLLFANHKDKKIRYEDGFRIIKRGQFLTSKRKLAERWMWNRRTVDKFLDLLVKDEMITIECTTKHTLITIVNYSIYQGDESENEPQDTPPTTPQDAPQDAPRSTPRSTPRSSTNNNDNNERSIKEKEIPKGISKKKNFAPPTLEEVKAYCEERKNGIDAQYFTKYIRETLLNTFHQEAKSIAEREISKIVKDEYEATIKVITEREIEQQVKREVDKFMLEDITVGGGWSAPTRTLSRMSYMSELVEKYMTEKASKENLVESAKKAASDSIEKFTSGMKNDINNGIKETFNDVTRRTLTDSVVQMLMASETYQGLANATQKLLK